MLKSAKAIDIVTRWHRTQSRKGRRHEPFVNHPLRVAHCLMAHDLADEDLISAALLHDMLEDTAYPPEELEAAFGSEVLAIVREVTDDKHLLKSMRKQHQVERAELLSLKARLIRIADKIDNVNSLIEDPPETWSVQRQREYIAWSRRVINRIRGTHPALEKEFDQVSAEAWARLTGAE